MLDCTKLRPTKVVSNSHQGETVAVSTTLSTTIVPAMASTARSRFIDSLLPGRTTG